MVEFGCMERVRVLSDLNRLLAAIKSLTGGRAERIPMRRLGSFLEQDLSLGHFAGVDDLAAVARLFRLAEVTGDLIGLTPVGLAFLGRNPAAAREFTDSQREMLVMFIIHSGSPLSREFQRILGEFSYDPDSGRFEATALVPGQASANLGIRFVCDSLGLVGRSDDGGRFLDPRFTKDIRRIIRILRMPEFFDREPTEEEIEMAREAEIRVWEDEKRRLEGAGRPDLAEAVEIISETYQDAGYDIESFEGASSQKEVHDLFIEVKESKGRETRFFISRNELARAREGTGTYRVKFVGGFFRGAKLDECRIDQIDDPSNALFDTQRYVLDAPKIFVREIRRKQGETATSNGSGNAPDQLK